MGDVQGDPSFAHMNLQNTSLSGGISWYLLFSLESKWNLGTFHRRLSLLNNLYFQVEETTEIRRSAIKRSAIRRSAISSAIRRFVIRDVFAETRSEFRRQGRSDWGPLWNPSDHRSTDSNIRPADVTFPNPLISPLLY